MFLKSGIDLRYLNRNQIIREDPGIQIDHLKQNSKISRKITLPCLPSPNAHPSSKPLFLNISLDHPFYLADILVFILFPELRPTFSASFYIQMVMKSTQLKKVQYPSFRQLCPSQRAWVNRTSGYTRWIQVIERCIILMACWIQTLYP